MDAAPPFVIDVFDKDGGIFDSDDIIGRSVI